MTDPESATEFSEVDACNLLIHNKHVLLSPDSG